MNLTFYELIYSEAKLLEGSDRFAHQCIPST